jgi:hypothetical protein
MRQMTEQVRQEERNQRATIHQARQQARSAFASQRAESDHFELHSRAIRGDATLGETEATRYVVSEWSNLFAYEECFFQHLDGMIDERRWRSNLNAMRFQLAAPGFRAAVATGRPLFEGEFGTFLDKLMAEIPRSQSTRSLGAIWHDALSAQLAPSSSK